MNEITERNSSGQYYVNTRLGVAKTKSAEDFQEFDSSTEVHKLLTELIEVNAKGFRGVVVTALTGLHINESYDPLNNFYGCNPRSIFEGGIWYALQENGIPCGKSDPLNVAKNVDQLNEDWAQGRRPQSAAMAAVKFLRIVMKAGKSKRARLIDYFFFRLWTYAESVTGYQLAEITSSTKSRQMLGTRLVEFTLKYPESGNLPQYLVSQLLEGVFRTSAIDVFGGDESDFGTNTTSKKPADIWLEIDGNETNLYEITVKPVSRKRLDDSLDTLNSTGHLNHSVTFICRIPTDIRELDVIDGSYTYNGKRFDFIDYQSFCCSLCALLNDEEFSIVLKSIGDFVNDMHISMRTKTGWNEFFKTEI
ncbi:MAG: hypothetical protein KZQ89_09280 [Candidatus Thiodiazotropha sp. (ex Lucinoma kastoroae)]|nr:hypothetical protein [Candidatus Thiodiazotropha sp. (ex Lucinoma kastoroae)]MCU7858778.1 hypothetical protein [Candidatus Thiodiazotropha sp. (ex Lucinoma kastoroae)]